MRATPPKTEKLILGIETSCDECSAAVVSFDPAAGDPAAPLSTLRAKSVATFSQIDLHKPFGGVVPEVASRNHLETINPMIDQALTEAGIRPKDLDAIAVTNRPGLVGALLVGVSAAKALAYALHKPLVPVHHLEGHAMSVFLDLPQPAKLPQTPTLIAVVSGGHTNLYLSRVQPTEWPADFLKTALVGRSRDDAAGEAFDKTAKLMGFPYPGGVWIDRTAREKNGNPQAFALPRALPQKDVLDFSFSGLKTAVSLEVKKLRQKGSLEKDLPDLCASVQEAIVDALFKKILLALKRFQCRSLVVVGGVAANSRFRERLKHECPVPVFFPQGKYCTDNAAMIAAAGAIRYLQGRTLPLEDLLTLNASASASAEV